MNPSNGQTLLLVEDCEDDVILFKRTLKKSGLAVQLAHVADGQQALDYLSGTGGFEDRVRFPEPSLVLLDLKMPQRDGHEVLQWARSKRELDTVCIAMLTSSLEPADVEKAYALGANCYFSKAIAVETLLELFAKVESARGTGGPRTVLNVAKCEPPPRQRLSAGTTQRS